MKNTLYLRMVSYTTPKKKHLQLEQGQTFHST